MITLTDEERRRFAAYCHCQGNTAAGLAEQMKKARVPSAMIEKMEIEAAAYTFVAFHLGNGESMTISNP